MPPSLELRASQKRQLAMLLKAKGSPERLDEMIDIVISEMDAEDVAYVQKINSKEQKK